MNIELEDHIRVRAYYIWENEGCPHGRHLAHWVQATDELSVVNVEAAAETKKPAKLRSAKASSPKSVAAKPAAPKAVKVAKPAKPAPAGAVASAPAKPRRSSRPAQVTLN